MNLYKMCKKLIIHIFQYKLKLKLRRTCVEKCEISQIFNSEIENGCTAGIYDFLYVFNCNILIKYVTITQNRQEKLYIKPNFINAAKTNDRPEPIVTYIFSYNNRSIRLCIRIGDSVRVSYE
jgi:hypothetical protein